MTNYEKMNMTPDEYEHNMKVLTALARVETLQKVANSEFMEHKAEDRIHFDRLYDSIEVIEKSIAGVPGLILKHSKTTKIDTMVDARKEFTPITDFKVFQTKVLYAVTGAITAGSLLGTVLSIFLAGSKLIS
jgi:hypothetical protein